MFSFNIKEKSDQSRTGILKLGLKDFKTPFYGLIHTDTKRLIHGSNLIKTDLPPINFNEIVIDHKGDIKKTSQIFSSRINNNYKSGVPNICQFRSSKNTYISKDELQEIVRIQSDSEKLSVITLPDPQINNFDNSWEKSMDYALKLATESYETGLTFATMPTISLDQRIELIEKKIQWLIKKDVKAVGLRATGQFSPRLLKATSIIKEKKESIWIHLFDIKKKYLELSQVHLVPLLTVDTITTKKGYPRTGYQRTLKYVQDEHSSDFPIPLGIPLEPDEPILKKKEEYRDVFEGKALGFLTKNERIQELGHELTCNCPICSKTRSIEELEGLLSRMDRKSLIQIHETVSYNDEFDKIKKAIHDNDLLKYYNKKILFKKNKNQISKKFPNITEPRYRPLW